PGRGQLERDVREPPAGGRGAARHRRRAPDREVQTDLLRGGVKVGTRSYMSIGEVLVMLKTEFRDVTISKIRFLEGEGLIDPERTPSGYRKFYDNDIDRLRTILRMQRDEYLPLKVIKERLENKEDEGAAKPALAPVEEEIATPPTGLHMSEEELAVATGVDKNRIRELESFGLLRAHGLNGDKYLDG